MTTPRLAVVVPTREVSLPPENITLATLAAQTWKDFRVIVHHDFGHGANWARNRGLEMCSEELVLFSDDDIEWLPNALEVMVRRLDAHPEASYVYGGYRMGAGTHCMVEFNGPRLKKINFVSTMAIIRRAHLPPGGWDEAIERFQDWDLWLTMLKAGHVGVWCGQVVFWTKVRPGITHGNSVTPLQADAAVRRKHGL